MPPNMPVAEIFRGISMVHLGPKAAVADLALAQDLSQTAHLDRLNGIVILEPGIKSVARAGVKYAFWWLLQPQTSKVSVIALVQNHISCGTACVAIPPRLQHQVAKKSISIVFLTSGIGQLTDPFTPKWK